MALSTLTSKGQLTVPKSIRDYLQIEVGDKIEFIIDEQGHVLVRLIINDDEVQAKNALKYVKKHAPVFISYIVLCEFSWVSTISYQIKKETFLHVMDKILRKETFILENVHLILCFYLR